MYWRLLLQLKLDDWWLFHPWSPSRSTQKAGPKTRSRMRASQTKFCRNNEDWYSVAKITSQEVALEYGWQIRLDVVTINPTLVLGPLLQPMCRTSCQFLIYFLKGSDLQLESASRPLNVFW